MAILIRDMDMPDTCSDCRFAVNGICSAIPEEEPEERSTEYTGWDGKLYACPLEDVGLSSFRIDRDTLEKLIDAEFIIGGR